MGLSDLFIDVANLPQDGYGFFQIIFLFCVYGYILMIASDMISDGSEFLLLIPACMYFLQFYMISSIP